VVPGPDAAAGGYAKGIEGGEEGEEGEGVAGWYPDGPGDEASPGTPDGGNSGGTDVAVGGVAAGGGTGWGTSGDGNVGGEEYAGPAG